MGKLGQNYKSHSVKALFGALEDNLIKLDTLNFECYSKIDRSITSLMIDAIRKTSSLSKLILCSCNWEPSFLSEILETLNESKSIKKFKLIDSDLDMPLDPNALMLNLNNFDCEAIVYLKAVGIQGLLKGNY